MSPFLLQKRQRQTVPGPTHNPGQQGVPVRIAPPRTLEEASPSKQDLFMYVCATTGQYNILFFTYPCRCTQKTGLRTVFCHLFMSVQGQKQPYVRMFSFFRILAGARVSLSTCSSPGAGWRQRWPSTRWTLRTSAGRPPARRRRHSPGRTKKKGKKDKSTQYPEKEKHYEHQKFQFIFIVLACF